MPAQVSLHSMGIPAGNAVYTLLHDLDPPLVKITIAEVWLSAKAAIPQRNHVIVEKKHQLENTSVRRKSTVAHS